MGEFVFLEDQDLFTIVPDNPHSIANVKPDTKILDGVIEDNEVDGICADFDVITIDKVVRTHEDEEEEQICVRGDWDASKYYGCPGEGKSFTVENLFSELTDNYQREVARQNLGIASAYAMLWGNLKGNLLNQKDLVTFVDDSISSNSNELIEEINLKLAQWACEIRESLDKKANIDSPAFTGTPTTTLPSLNDSSKRIASTEWVQALVNSIRPNKSIKYVQANPAYVLAGTVTDITVSWEYMEDITSQSINGIKLPIEQRSYTFTEVSEELLITLECISNNREEYEALAIPVIYPIFYGVSNVMDELSISASNEFLIDAGDSNYIYVLAPTSENLRISVDGLVGGFIRIGTSNMTGINYTAYKSVNYGLGKTYIKVLGLREDG